jgi:hypothetical protein
MAAKKKGKPEQRRQVRKTVTVDAAKLARAREVLGLASDADVLRVALEHLLEHFPDHSVEEE